MFGACCKCSWSRVQCIVLQLTRVLSCLQTMLMKPKPLTLAGVYATLRAIALTKGAGSSQRKQDLIKQLVSRCRWVPLCHLLTCSMGC